MNAVRVGLVLLLVWLVRKLFWCLRWLWCHAHGKPLPPEPRGLPQQSGRVFDGHLETAEPLPPLAIEPDGPVPFGYKTAWLAVRCDDAERVMAALKPKVRQMANWTSGLAAVGAGRVFVSPCLDGYVLVVGLDGQPSPGFFGGAFAEVQVFATHRVTECHSWSRWRDGGWVREYCWWGEGGQVLEDRGALTPEELALGFDGFPRKGRENEAADFPNEEDVLKLAAAWGIDPRFENNTYPPSVGWLCAAESSG